MNNTSSPERKNKRFSKPIHILGGALVCISIVFAAITYMARPYDKANNTYIDVVIPNGSSTSEIAEALEEKGIIESKGRFTFLSKVLLYNNKLKPGIYSLSPSMNMNEIAGMLINSITTDNGFKLPAGYTVSQTAEALDQAGFVDKDKFVSVAQSGVYAYQFSFLEGSSSLEGFLLPGQYEMSKDADEGMIITTMLYAFDEFFTDEYRSKASELGLSTRQVVILASIVEEETKSAKERPVIAGILLNRISSGLGIEGGFPSTPLCSPSRESIEAVLFAESSDYLYYVLSSKLDGSHVYAVTAEEYQELKASYDEAYAAKKSAKDGE